MQAAHTILRMLKPQGPDVSDTDGGGGGGSRLVVNGGRGWNELAIEGEPKREEPEYPEDYDWDEHWRREDAGETPEVSTVGLAV